MQGLANFLIAVLLIVSTPMAVARALEDLDWVEVQTPNFQVRSLADAKKTVKLARYMEIFRAAVAMITNVSQTQSPIPIHIYILRGARDFRQLGIERGMVGQLIPTVRDYSILIRDSTGMKESSTILHEYVHFLVRNNGHQHYPSWYDEGLAEYLSAVAVHDEYFSVGLPHKQRFGNLAFTRWVDMRKILASGKYYQKWNGEQKAMFYAEAWALVHYLVNRRNRVSTLSNDMDRYIGLVESNAGSQFSEVDAFEKAFGVSADKLNKEVKSYIRKGIYRFIKIRIAALVPSLQPRIVKLSREQAALGLGQLALRLRKPDRGEHWFSIAATAAHGRRKGSVMCLSSGVILLLPNCTSRKRWILRRKIHTANWASRSTGTPGHRRRTRKRTECSSSNLPVRLLLAEAYAEAGRKEEATAAARSVVAWSDNDTSIAKQARELMAALAPGTDDTGK